MPDKPVAPHLQIDGILRLETEWYPIDSKWEEETENALTRELVRQAVLIAARDELGLVTRDATLGEPFSCASLSAQSEDDAADNTALPAALRLRLDVDNTGNWQARLLAPGGIKFAPVWAHESKFKFNPPTIYAQLAPELDKLTSSIAESLRQAGVEGRKPKTINNDLPPSADILKQLSEMNVSSQYSVVHAAHQAMRQNGASPAWLGVLVRGYANLALLTRHHWSSHQQAFSARSLLYAERLLRTSKDKTDARWHRAYARSLVGTHVPAFEDIAALANEENKADAQAPPWSKLLAPYLEFNADQLSEVASKDPALKELAGALRWEVHRSYEHGRWIYEKGLVGMKECPHVYGIYSVMANWPALMVQRYGMMSGAREFAASTPQQVSSVANLPKSVHDTIAPMLANDGEPKVLGDEPMSISRSLIAANCQADKQDDFSLSILGEMIAEEQFVQAANLLRVGVNAVEHSQASTVDHLATLTENHRYAPYIRTFAVARGDTAQLSQLLGSIEIADPNPNMKQLISKCWRIPLANGLIGAKLAFRTTWSSDYTFPRMHETYYRTVSDWSHLVKIEQQRTTASRLRAMNPSSPNALRLQWDLDQKHNAEQLAKFEAQLTDDPVGWLSLGFEYARIKDISSAKRCYERSLKISPSQSATEGLAKCYYDEGDKKRWRETLESYLEVEDLALSHADMHLAIGNESIRQRDWQEAEKHALIAAETYSAQGLGIASRVYEGKREWEKSEYFIAQSTQSYPSSAGGTGWYFWCLRTGRGDRETARKFADHSIRAASADISHNNAQRSFVYQILVGIDRETALASLIQRAESCPTTETPWDKAWRFLQTIIVSTELHNAADKETALRQLADLAGSLKADNAEIAEALDALQIALSESRITDAKLTELERVGAELAPDMQCDFWYYLGAALEQRGNADAADKYLKRSAFGGPYYRYLATLAGDRLVKKHGADRGGLPEEFAKQEEQFAHADSDEEPANEDAQEPIADGQE
jgi:tetratricopeptide (TPR) repeat protein